MFLHVSVILFKEGGLCSSMHHRSHDQEGLCPGGSLSVESLSMGRPRQRPPLYGNARVVRILLECILVLIFSDGDILRIIIDISFTLAEKITCRGLFWQKKIFLEAGPFQKQTFLCSHFKKYYQVQWRI